MANLPSYIPLSDQLPEEDFKYSPLPGRDYIRVITILPSETPDDPFIKCEIRTRQLDKSTKYEALSYSWGMNADGDAAPNRAISICGKTKYVTRNLFEGLFRLRADAAPMSRKLWIDAICINQSDDEERTNQVRKMGLIFRCASRTLIWLGEGNRAVDDFNMLMAIECYSQCAGNDAHVWEDEDGETHSICAARPVYRFYHSKPVNRSTKILYAAETFFLKRYFCRRWIFQELYNSSPSNIQVYWGRCNCALTALFESMDPLSDASDRNMISQDPYGKMSPSMYRIYRMLGVVLRSGHSDEMKHWSGITNCVEALERCHYMECSDPRDRLFSILGISDNFGIIPDYSLSTDEVSVQLSRTLIANNHIISVLQSSSIPDTEDVINAVLPSWVPDLRGTFRGLSQGEALKAPSPNIHVSDDNVLTLPTYMFGLVESCEPYQNLIAVNIRCTSDHLVNSQSTQSAPRLPAVVSKRGHQPHLGPMTCQDALQHLQRGCTRHTYYVYQAPQPSDICCSLTSEELAPDYCKFVLRIVDLQKEVFKLAGTSLFKSGVCRQLPPVVIQATVNVV